MDKDVGRFEFQAFATDDELAEAAGQRFATRVIAARDAGRARPPSGPLGPTLSSQSSTLLSVALSGGRIANKFFTVAARLLAREGWLGSSTHFFWADERCVPPDHPESNYRTASELLLGPLGIPISQVHRIPGELNPEDAALRASTEYAGVLARHGVLPPRLDLALLGMGEDGHIASLFPQEPAETVADFSAFRAVVGPKPPPNRVTMGYGALAAAREVWVLVSGGGKEKALSESLSPEGKTPLARLLRMQPNTHVLSSVPLAAQ